MVGGKEGQMVAWHWVENTSNETNKGVGGQ